ncbi:uncharacterized protein B0H18DRAFT_1117726 [Fomitopsis serialis]|uniref:uncharacterized protein n=1 Tax=Fomitopsis serialis TaxID=139415 RepID=UPI0020084083|nr:uncharacterized protein B0H18DRAFT_1117726 [Neoantrodia serialis]KAH9928908.1 hypothetical protein B0H18DRAFT_1117726 [Neoantrodia serialis]
MSESKATEVKPNGSEPQVAPDSVPTLPEIKPTEPLSDTIDDDEFEEWKPRGPPKLNVAGPKTGVKLR